MLTEWESHNQTRVHLEATGLLTAGELLIQIAQSCVPAGGSPCPGPPETQPLRRQSVPPVPTGRPRMTGEASLF